MKKPLFVNILRIKLLVVLIAVLLLSTVIFSAPVKSQGGVGVLNDGPTFVDISVEEEDEKIYVHVVLRDLNGWTNIYLVNVTVFDNLDNPISQVIYRQYGSPSDNTPVIQWEEIEGELLIREESNWNVTEMYPWVVPDYAVENVGLDVTFIYTSFPGDHISIIALDKGETNATGVQVKLLNCTYEGPFSAEFTPPPMIENFIIPLSVSLIIAAAAAVILTWRRYYSNKIAKAIEAKEAPSKED